MIVEEKHFLLKDGREALLRSPREEEAAELIAFLQTVASETEFLLAEPEGVATVSVENEAAWIRSHVESPLSALICVYVDGRLVADCDVAYRSDRKKLSKRGRVGVSVIREFWGLGIGSAMMAEQIRIARAWGLHKLELSVCAPEPSGTGTLSQDGLQGVRPLSRRLLDGGRLLCGRDHDGIIPISFK